jgi:hypothetical protein
MIVSSSSKEIVIINMPGFTAEASLEKSSVLYQERGIGTTHATRIVPQLRSCTPTQDGGLWCCVPGKGGWICWWTAPPTTIWI